MEKRHPNLITMEPKKYIQFCHNGKVRIYKGKLPPAENGPFEEYLEGPTPGPVEPGVETVSIGAAKDEAAKGTDWVLILSAAFAAAIFIGGSLWLVL